MALVFVTGGDSGFFPTLLCLLQSFSERIAGKPLFVCDFGFRPAEQEFLRRRDLLLERPALLPPGLHPYQYKSALVMYLRERSLGLAPGDTIIWLDGDLVMMNASLGDYAGVAAELAELDLDVAICASPTGHTVGDEIASLLALGLKAEPFARVAADAAIDLGRPYCSSGFFFCRSADLLQRWCNLALATEHHTIIDQNMLNVAMHRSLRLPLLLDCDIWQAQFRALDAVRLVPEDAEYEAAFVGEKSVKALHVTSPLPEHIFVGRARFCAGAIALDGMFKVFRREALMMLQLRLLGRLMARYGEELVSLGCCHRLAEPIQGIGFHSTEND